MKLVPLFEYLESDTAALKRYLTCTDDQKKSEMAYLAIENYEFIDDWLSENHPDVLSEISDEGLEGYEYADYLVEHHDEVFKEFGEYVLENAIKLGDSIGHDQLPTWFHFMFTDIIKNQWLIHCTDDAYGIEKEGFTRGVDSMDKLGYTCHLSEYDRENGGYNFAYTISDFGKYGMNTRSKPKYGKQLVIFTASGVRGYHYGDGEYQVIFRGSTAANIYPIILGDDGDWEIADSHGRVKFKNERAERVVKWVADNYRQLK
jgi:hypothetical protein